MSWKHFFKGDCCVTKIAAAVAGIVVLYVVVKWTRRFTKNRSVKKSYRKKIEKKRAELDSRIKTLEKKLEVNGALLPDDRLYILSLSPTDLLKELKARKLTAVDVLHAYQAKAIEVTKKLNCVTAFVSEAEEHAKLLDDMSDRNLPLHGMPISIKEEFAMKNYDSVFGLAKFIDKPNTKDAVMVTALRRIGAVPFCRTNIPQVLYSYSSVNPVYGLTRNPFLPSRTAGGSSSGEAALIGGGGSVLGLGSDIAGSLRIPSHFCGITALKPTSGRLSTVGEMPIVPGIQGIKLTPGIMGKDVDIITATYKALFDKYLMNELHPLAVPLNWRNELYDIQRPLRVGVLYDFSITPATPGCARAVRRAVEAFEKSGHSVVPFELSEDEMTSLIQSVGKCALADNVEAIGRLLENEDISAAAMGLHIAYEIPEWARKGLDFVLKSLFTDKISILGATKSIDLMNVLAECDRLKNVILDRWTSANIDVWLTPAFPFPAVAPDVPSLLLDTVLYVASFNFLDFPAGIVPTTFETTEDQENLEEYNHGGDIFLKFVQRVTRGSEGLPIGVQIVGQPWKEETVLRAMKELQDALRNKL